jgi:hypothetical protein
LSVADILPPLLSSLLPTSVAISASVNSYPDLSELLLLPLLEFLSVISVSSPESEELYLISGVYLLFLS